MPRPEQGRADAHERGSFLDRQFEVIGHAWRLDYPDEYFGAVIGSGVLEHVANIGESLTELWRVLRPGGALLLTHLPNARSWSEWLSRRTAPELAHVRRFRPRALGKQLLVQCTEPVVRPFRRLLPPLAGMDFSCWFASIALILVQMLVLAPLADLAAHI